jgi:hypothetical protein
MFLSRRWDFPAIPKVSLNGEGHPPIYFRTLARPSQAQGYNEMCGFILWFLIFLSFSISFIT